MDLFVQVGIQENEQIPFVVVKDKDGNVISKNTTESPHQLITVKAGDTVVIEVDPQA